MNFFSKLLLLIILEFYKDCNRLIAIIRFLTKLIFIGDVQGLHLLEK